MAIHNPIKDGGFLKIAKSGIASVSQSLEMMASNRLSLDILWAGSVPTPRLSEIAGDPESIVVGVYMPVNGDIPGHALVIFPVQSALLLVDLLTDQPAGTVIELNEMEISVVKEITNIITSSYISSIADYYQATLMPDPPMLAVDMAAAIVDNVLLSSGYVDAETLSIVTRFRSHLGKIDGYFLYLPENSAFVGSE